MILSKWLRKRSKSAPNGIENGFSFEEDQFHVIRSKPDGLFTICVRQDAFAVLEQQGKIELDLLGVVPELIFNKCRKLGFFCEPIHTIVKLENEPHPFRHECSMGISRIDPPIILRTGEKINRGILIFKEFSSEMGSLETVIISGYEQTGRIRNLEERQKYINAMIPMRQTRCITGLSHEIVHLLVTDELSGHFKHLNLEQIELLTDSITLETFIDLYGPKKMNDPARMGFIEGLPYLSNLFQNSKDYDPPSAMDIGLSWMHERAKRIISGCSSGSGFPDFGDCGSLQKILRPSDL